jgi:hypothetical protein
MTSGMGGQERLAVSVLSAGADNLTSFADETIDWLSADGASGVNLTEFVPATNVGFLRLPKGYQADWHPAPRKQYVLVLQGAMAVEAGSGERRVFEPGSVLMVTDTSGPGHRTGAVGDQGVLLAWIPVPE